LGVEWEHDGCQGERGGVCKHKLVRLVRRLPVEGGQGEEGAAAAPHHKVMPLVELVAAILEVLRHKEVGHTQKLQPEEAQEER